MTKRNWGVIGLALAVAPAIWALPAPARGEAPAAAAEAVPPEAPAPPETPAPPATWSAPLDMRPYPEQSEAERKAERHLLLGEAQGEGYALPLRFVLSLAIEPGYDPGSADAKAWLASLPPTEGRAALDGRCLSGTCVVSGGMAPDNSTVTLTVTLDGPGPGGRYEVRRGGSGPAELSGSLSLTPVGAELPGLGALAEAETNAGRLGAALRWQGYEISGWGEADQPPDGDLREALAGWQQADGKRAPTGLVFADDIAALEAEATRLQTESGWTLLGGEALGWRLGVPAKLLSKSGQKGAVKSWRSPDGAYELSLTLAPAKDAEAMDAMFEQDTTETDKRTVPFYNRSGDDYSARYVEGKRVHHVMVHNRDGGFARAVFAYPEDDPEGSRFEGLIDHSFVVADDFKPKP